MILFISKYIESEDATEGMNSRIAAIDNLVSDNDRVYLDVRYKFQLLPETTRINSKVTVIKVHAILHLWIILFFAVKSNIIYVHSVYNSLRGLCLYLFFNKKVITDFHGLVSEEELIRRRFIKSIIYTATEYLVVSRSKYFISVSMEMKKYFENKYLKTLVNIIILPIFNNDNIYEIDKDYGSELNVVYSGGAQAWQNISKIITAINRTVCDYKYYIFSAELEVFKDILCKNDLVDSVKLSCLPKNDLVAFYKRMHFGFILRDDVPVNRACCPTKLIEYLNYGIIPIVLQPEIGDFNSLNYSYILYDDFCLGKIPSEGILKDMVLNNYNIIVKMKNIVSQGERQIINVLAIGEDCE